MKYIFGPVPSRRLGFSLGVDIIPHKTCSFDCIYCECGKTTCKTTEAVDTFRPEAILDELERVLAGPSLNLDHLTISGSGEPTLHPHLGLILKEIKKMTDVPVALITNSSLFFKDEVLEKVLEADIVIPSLDAPDPAVFEIVNRPHPSLSFEQLLSGLTHLSRSRGGPPIWLEILLLEGINDSAEQIKQFSRLCEKINPEKIQLNTVVRPPIESYARSLGYRRMAQISKDMGPKTEIIAESLREKTQPPGSLVESEIKDMVARRPCTVEDIARCVGLSEGETAKLLTELVQTKKIRYEIFNQRGYYRGN
jgi:wyosine [tRNA(Phe)-imidazoG37] synthetase (radical SAM superfamily)